jgi:predicted enzyme related to lactoylglutathione lyase
MPTTARIDYVELWAPSAEPMKGFYGKAFGWTFTDYGPGYAAFTDGRDGEAGGINATGEPRFAPLVILYADDLDAARASVTAAGGEILGPDLEFPGGRRFNFRDPAGNVLAVWTKA